MYKPRNVVAISATPIKATSHFMGLVQSDASALGGAPAAFFAGAPFGAIQACSLWNCPNHATQSDRQSSVSRHDSCSLNTCSVPVNAKKMMGGAKQTPR